MGNLMGKVKFTDLKAQYAPIRTEHEAAISRVLSSCAFIQGEEVRLFEQEFAARIGTKCCVSVSSGTDALFLALVALGIEEGDEVIVPANTFIATALAVVHTGAIPVFADVDPYDMTLDPDRLEERITERTRAVIPVHLYGFPAFMERILEIADRHELLVIEDAAQAFGSYYGEKAAGSLGIASAWSYYPTKNLGCFGDGGAITTDDEELAEKLRYLREYGQVKKNDHRYLGYNHRLDTLQAAVLRVNLRYADVWVERRRELALLYDELLEDCTQVRPIDPLYEGKHAYHLYVPQVLQRDKLRSWLASQGVETQIHYPVSCHLQPCFWFLPPSTLSVSEHLSRVIISLPMHPSLAESDVLYVCDKIAEFYQRADLD